MDIPGIVHLHQLWLSLFLYYVHTASVYILCRRGNDSQVAVTLLKEEFSDRELTIKNIDGGLECWADTIDPLFPKY